MKPTKEQVKALRGAAIRLDLGVFNPNVAYAYVAEASLKDGFSIHGSFVGQEDKDILMHCSVHTNQENFNKLGRDNIARSWKNLFAAVYDGKVYKARGQEASSAKLHEACPFI